MPTRTPIPVSRAMRQISANLDLARRQQRIPVALLAERAGLSMPTVTKMLRTGNGSFENFLRIARLLGLLDGVQHSSAPLTNVCSSILSCYNRNGLNLSLHNRSYQ